VRPRRRSRSALNFSRSSAERDDPLRSERVDFRGCVAEFGQQVPSVLADARRIAALAQPPAAQLERRTPKLTLRLHPSSPVGTNVERDGVVLEYTGELVSDTEIRFKRRAGGGPFVQFVATRTGTR